MKGKRIPIILLAILVITLPLLLLGIKQTLDSRSRAAAADKLEAEGGTLGGNATSQSNSSASGGSYVVFGTNQVNNPSPIPTSNKIYGMGIAGDSLANTPLGGPSSGSTQQFMRFKAEQTSNLVSFRFYYLGPPEPGYAGGTGGSWSVGVYEDDNSQDHLPAGNPITTVTNVLPMSKSTSSTGRLINLSTPVALTAGKIYHLVFTNTDPDPITNYFSPDYWYYKNIPDRRAGSTPYPSQIFPLLPNSDWGHGYKVGSTWWIREGYLPILDLAYSNGAHQGWSYGEASYNSTDEIGEISGASKMAREKITVSGGNKIVTGAGIRALKSSGNSPLIVTLENSSNQILNSISIPASNFVSGRGPDFISSTDWDDLGSPAKYAFGNFSSPVTLANGQTYYLKFSTANDSTYWAWVNRKLISYGYDPSTYFKDGVAQYTRDGINWLYLGRSKGDQDLQFYFTIQ